VEDVAVGRPVRGFSLSELRAAYAGRRVLLTGHTGFKGGWLALWLHELGAVVTGYALEPDTDPALFADIAGAELCRHIVGDVRDLAHLSEVVRDTQPDVVFHLAAQALVRASYEQPLETLATNVMGTANLLEAIRASGRPCAVVIVTSDKCYENREWVYGYREIDPMGGHDPYSASKGAAELVVSSYRRSFFPPARLEQHGVAVATARAGNVIGGGDWARDRLVPDIMRALAAGQAVPVRNPHAVRPWQHVLEPLSGYLLLGTRLLARDGAAPYCEAWNFGPGVENSQPVKDLVEGLIEAWGAGTWDDVHDPAGSHEAGMLRLSIDKACHRLGWAPRWGFRESIERTAAWYRARQRGLSAGALRALSLEQINDYVA